MKVPHVSSFTPFFSVGSASSSLLFPFNRFELSEICYLKGRFAWQFTALVIADVTGLWLGAEFNVLALTTYTVEKKIKSKRYKLSELRKL